jgi:tetratricopeptide (TPR) repeat protein
VASLESRFGRTWPRAGDGYEGLSLVLSDRDEGCGATAGGCTSGYGQNVKVGLRQEFFLTGHQDLGLTLCHELAHAYFRRHMSRGDYSRFARWAREGSAVHLAGQLPSKLYTHLFRNLDAPWEGVDGLEGAHRFADYFEDALAFAWMDRLGGGTGSLGVLAGILDGEELFAAISRVLRLDRAAFLAGAREDGVARVREAWAALPPRLFEGEAARKAGERERAIAAFEDVLRGEGVQVLPGGKLEGQVTPGAGFAIRQLAKLNLYRWEAQERAGDLYQALLAGVPKDFYGREVASVRYELAGLDLARGRFAAALDGYARVFVEHVESPMLQLAAAMGIARAYFRLESFPQALEWLEAYRPDGSYVDEEVAFMKGVSLFRTCRKAEAIRALENLAGGPASHIWVKKGAEELDAIRNGSRTAPGCLNN